MRPDIVTWRPDCEPYGISGPDLMRLLAATSSFHYPIYLYMSDIGVYDYVDQECFDCRLRGGTVERPDFWE